MKKLKNTFLSKVVNRSLCGQSLSFALYCTTTLYYVEIRELYMHSKFEAFLTHKRKWRIYTSLLESQPFVFNNGARRCFLSRPFSHSTVIL